jgi:hypothetical protein
MKHFGTFLIFLLPCILCSGCLFHFERDTASPGARGVVVDSQTHNPLSGATVVVSRLSNMGQLPPVADALTNTRPPIVTTGKSGRFSIHPERHWELVPFLVGPYYVPPGTLVVQKTGYEPAIVQLWGDIVPLSAQPTNFFVVPLNPISN